MTFKGPATRSIHLLELRFDWSNQVDFMSHVIWMSVAKVMSVTVKQGVEEVCYSNRFVAAWIEKQRLESR